MSYPISPIDGQIYGNKRFNSTKNSWTDFNVWPIGSVYFQGVNDLAPSILFPGTTWEDVSWEEANCTRRIVGDLSGARFTGVPAKLSVSVTSGVPTISIVSGGSNYLNGSSGSLNLIITGTCTTQMVATATVTSGAITAIVVGTAGVGYTSGSVAVYDGVSGHGDLIQKHKHPLSGANGTGGERNYHYNRGANCVAGEPEQVNTRWSVYGSIDSDENGSPRAGSETSGAWITVIKWRRTA